MLIKVTGVDYRGWTGGNDRAVLGNVLGEMPKGECPPAGEGRGGGVQGGKS